MDQSAFTQLTGITPSSSQSARFDSVAELSGEALEELLGWPLDPTDWGNQYLEIGKAKDEWWSCPDVDTSDLDAPDAVVGATRLYDWNVNDLNLHIDPATKINALKIVRDGITYKTFDIGRYSLVMDNGQVPFGRYIRLHDGLPGWMLALWPRPNLFFGASRASAYVQVAIDADWAFAADSDDNSTLPTKLQKTWADLIYYELDVQKRDLKSESMLSHSYTRNPHADPTVANAATIAKYVGPKGTANTPLDLV